MVVVILLRILLLKSLFVFSLFILLTRTFTDKLAALWPFLGICVEVAILCVIIFIYEKRRAKQMEEEERREEADHL